MKLRIIASALLIVLVAGISTQAGAAPWRGHYRGGWCAPHPYVRIAAPRLFVPPVQVVVGGGGYYGRPYYAHPYYGHAYYGHPRYDHHYYRR